MSFSSDDLTEIFTYHPPTTDQLEHYQAIRDGALQFAKTLVAHSPVGPDQTAAIRLLRQTVMTANAAIALDGRF